MVINHLLTGMVLQAMKIFSPLKRTVFFYSLHIFEQRLTWLFQDEDDKNLVREYNWDPSESLGQHTTAFLDGAAMC